MVQTIVLYNTPTDNNMPALLYQGELAGGVGPNYTRLWIGDGTENRLLLSDNPADTPLFGGGGNYLPLTGGDLTGPLTISVPAANPALTVAGRGVVYSQLSSTNSFSFFANGAVIIPFVNGVAGSGFLNVGGGNMTGALALSGDPINPMQAATKQYVDTMLPLAGGTMSGPIVLAGDATTALQAVPLQQLDAAIAAIPPAGASVVVEDTPPASPEPGDLWWSTVNVKLYMWDGGQWVVVSNVPEGGGGGGPPFMGVADGSDAASGMVGEYLFVNFSGSATPGQFPQTLTLTPGDWDVGGNLLFHANFSSSTAPFWGGVQLQLSPSPVPSNWGSAGNVSAVLMPSATTDSGSTWTGVTARIGVAGVRISTAVQVVIAIWLSTYIMNSTSALPPTSGTVVSGTVWARRAR